METSKKIAGQIMRRHGVSSSAMTISDMTYHAMYRCLCLTHPETYFETMHGGINLSVP